jgi:hypothetical protein
MKIIRKRFLIILGLVLLVAASGSLNPAAASSVNVSGYDNGHEQGFGYDVGIVYDYAYYVNEGIIAQGEASTLGTVRLSATSTGNIIDIGAVITDKYTFTNLTNPGATGNISGLYIKTSYSGVLSYGDGYVEFSAPGGWIQLTYDSSTDTYVTITYTGINGAYTKKTYDNSTIAVSGEFIWPTTANFGEATDITLNFNARAVSGGTPDSSASYANFYNTANFSFYADGMSLGVTSEGGFNNVPLPGTVWLLGSGLVGLAGFRMRGKNKA